MLKYEWSLLMPENEKIKEKLSMNTRNFKKFDICEFLVEKLSMELVPIKIEKIFKSSEIDDTSVSLHIS